MLVDEKYVVGCGSCARAGVLLGVGEEIQRDNA